MLTLDEVMNITKDQYVKMSKEEQQLIMTILNEMKSTGTSTTLQDLWYQDYDEIPVSITEFICNPRYLGKSTRNGESIYPFWRDKYKEIFDKSINYEEIVLTGAIGVGKTRTAVVCLCYLLYTIMCLKNPQEYFRFNEGDKITVFFLNINLKLAEGVGYKTMHQYLLNSPWFMERGTAIGRTNILYKPPHNIDITFGSKSDHALGQQVFCLAGNTLVVTDEGIYKIEDLVNKQFKVYCVKDDKDIVLSNNTTAIQTAYTNDYYEIILEDDTIIKCTPNHMFMLKDMTYKRADELDIGDDLYYVEYIK